MDKNSEQRVSYFKDNKNYKGSATNNPKHTGEVTLIYNQERVLGELNIDRA